MAGSALEAFFGSPESVRACGDALQHVAKGLTTVRTDLDGQVACVVVPMTWEGETASSFRGCWDQQSAAIGEVAQAATVTSTTLLTLATQLETALGQFRAAEAAAAASACYITPAYAVMPYHADPSGWAAARAVQVQVDTARQLAIEARATAAGELRSDTGASRPPVIQAAVRLPRIDWKRLLENIKRLFRRPGPGEPGHNQGPPGLPVPPPPVPPPTLPHPALKPFGAPKPSFPGPEPPRKPDGSIDTDAWKARLQSKGVTGDLDGVLARVAASDPVESAGATHELRTAERYADAGYQVELVSGSTVPGQRSADLLARPPGGGDPISVEAKNAAAPVSRSGLNSNFDIANTQIKARGSGQIGDIVYSGENVGQGADQAQVEAFLRGKVTPDRLSQVRWAEITYQDGGFLKRTYISRFGDGSVSPVVTEVWP